MHIIAQQLADQRRGRIGDSQPSAFGHDRIAELLQAAAEQVADLSELAVADADQIAVFADRGEQVRQRHLRARDLDRSGQTKPVAAIIEFDLQRLRRDLAAHLHGLSLGPDDRRRLLARFVQRPEQMQRRVIGRGDPLMWPFGDEVRQAKPLRDLLRRFEFRLQVTAQPHRPVLGSAADQVRSLGRHQGFAQPGFGQSERDVQARRRARPQLHDQFPVAGLDRTGQFTGQIDAEHRVEFRHGGGQPAGSDGVQQHFVEVLRQQVFDQTRGPAVF